MALHAGMSLKFSLPIAVLQSGVVSVTLGVLLVIAAFFIFVTGWLILPRKAGLREWKRTLGVWSISLSCVLFAAAVFFFEPSSDDITPSALFWLSGFIAMWLGVFLIWDKIDAAPTPASTNRDDEETRH